MSCEASKVSPRPLDDIRGSLRDTSEQTSHWPAFVRGSAGESFGVHPAPCSPRPQSAYCPSSPIASFGLQ